MSCELEDTRGHDADTRECDGADSTGKKTNGEDHASISNAVKAENAMEIDEVSIVTSEAHGSMLFVICFITIIYIIINICLITALPPPSPSPLPSP